MTGLVASIFQPHSIADSLFEGLAHIRRLRRLVRHMRLINNGYNYPLQNYALNSELRLTTSVYGNHALSSTVTIVIDILTCISY